MIEEKVKDILKKYRNLEQKKDWKNQKLLGNDLKFSARDLINVYVELEKEFDIHFKEKDIVAGKFDTFDAVSYTHLKQKTEKENADAGSPLESLQEPFSRPELVQGYGFSCVLFRDMTQYRQQRPRTPIRICFRNPEIRSCVTVSTASNCATGKIRPSGAIIIPWKIRR